MSLLKKPKIVFLIVVLILALLVLMFNGLRYGLEFSGGTQFVLTLDEEVTDLDKLQRITNTISQRLDWSGLKDVKVSSWGERFVTAQVAVSDPEDVARIEEILQKQGRFENIFESEILFTGDDIISVSKDPSKGYGISSAGEDGYRWTLPFVLSTSAARKLQKVHITNVFQHLLEIMIVQKTYFFIDRPKNAIALIPTKIYQEEEFLPMDPLFSGGSQIRADELLQNAGFEFIIVDDVDGNVKNKILELKDLKDFSNCSSVRIDTQQLQDLNLDLVVVAKQDPYPWLWSATG
jgi:preprotein translocase subunit SecD